MLPLVILGGAQASAFPNTGIDLREAIRKQSREFTGNSIDQGFNYGILGSVEFKTSNHRFKTDWNNVLTRIVDESSAYEECDATAQGCSPKMLQWRGLLKQLKGLPVDVQLAQLNKSINRMATYADDSKTFGKKDYWATPLEFLKGKADCEDFAAMKFWSLLELGYRNDQLRLAVVRDQRRRIMHAVVTVRSGERTIVLDSLFDHPVEQRHVLKYAPIFSANLNTNWTHIVSRKIRVGYLNQLERRGNGHVLPAKVEAEMPVKVRRVEQPAVPVTLAQGGFVDWT